jgi:glutaredoxin
MAGDHVVIYGTDACPYTTKAREDYAERGFEVEYIDVSADPAKLDEMLELTQGQREQPVIVENAEVTIGFGGT